MSFAKAIFHASKVDVFLATATGLISGFGSAALISLINASVNGFSLTLLLWYFFLVLVVLVASIFSQILLIKLSQDIIYNLRLRLSEGILASPLQHLESLGSSKLLATLTEDIKTLSNTAIMFPYAIIDITIIVGCLAYLSWLSATMFLVVAVVIFGSIISVNYVMARARRELTLAREEEDKLYKHFRSIIDGIKELKLHWQRRQEFLTEELQASAETSRSLNNQAFTTFAISGSYGQLLFFIAVGVLLLIMQNFGTENQSAYLLTLAYLMLPFQNLLQRLPLLFKADVALRKIETMSLAIASQTEPSIPPQPTLSHWRSLRLKGIAHRYYVEGEKGFLLGPLDLEIRFGEILFIIGGNGSGKSTLAKLITGLYVPDKGEIWLDGVLITSENLDWYRQYFTAIFSDYCLFERLLGIARADIESQSQKYLQALALEGKVHLHGNRLSTLALSQGQRKRLALLTALLEDRPIYLFDEWAADQDPYFKEIFYKEFLPELKAQGKTIIAITHDNRYFNIADRVIKLEYGKCCAL